MPFFVFGQGSPRLGLSISPLTFELLADPGDEIPYLVRVFNTSDLPISVTMAVEDFAPVGEEGQVALRPEDETYTFSLARWVEVNPKRFELAPGGSQEVEFLVSVPEDAEPGGHYGSVVASMGGRVEGGGAAIAQKVGSLLLLRVSGIVQEELSVLSFEAPPFSEYGPVRFTARFENTGTVHLKPRGFIHVKNMRGKEVAKLDLPQRNVLPGSVRRIETDLEEKWLFGKYEATLTGIYGSRNEPFSRTVSFWVLPWKLVAGAGTIMLIVLLALFVTRRRLGLAMRILMKGSSETRGGTHEA